MITLVMEETEGLQKPIELKINDKVFKYHYNNETPDESFFKLLENYINYKIKVEFKSKSGTITKVGVIRDVKPTKQGVFGIVLDDMLLLT